MDLAYYRSRPDTYRVDFVNRLWMVTHLRTGVLMDWF